MGATELKPFGVYELNGKEYTIYKTIEITGRLPFYFYFVDGQKVVLTAAQFEFFTPKTEQCNN